MTCVENTPGPTSKASERLKNFIQKQMRMSHIYQPVMIKTLLGNAGRATIREVVSAFLAHDEKVSRSEGGRICTCLDKGARSRWYGDRDANVERGSW